MYLEKIDAPQDLRGLTTEQLHALADEIREALLRKLSVHGGHIGPNLGMVEATIALHRVFDSPKDKIIYDVSHQSYVHKMLTGRRKAFLDPADYEEVSGYTNPQESEHDHFTIGHTSTSVSLACGLAKARDLRGGAALVVAALSAQGKSFVEETRHIDRGYAGLWEVLASLGGRIGREMPPLDAAVKKIPSKKQIYLAFGAKR